MRDKQSIKEIADAGIKVLNVLTGLTRGDVIKLIAFVFVYIMREGNPTDKSIVLLMLLDEIKAVESMLPTLEDIVDRRN